MTHLAPPLDLELRRTLLEELAERRHPVGSRFPPQLALSDRFRYARHAVRKAWMALQA